jgi:hypothetical protein
MANDPQAASKSAHGTTVILDSLDGIAKNFNKNNPSILDCFRKHFENFVSGGMGTIILGGYEGSSSISSPLLHRSPLEDAMNRKGRIFRKFDFKEASTPIWELDPLKETLASDWSTAAFQERLREQVVADVAAVQSTIVGFGAPKEGGLKDSEDIMAATRRLCMGLH